MPEENAGESTDLWTSFLDFLSRIITPDWGDVIGWLPLQLSALVVLVLLFIAYRWWRAGDLNRSRVPRRLAAGTPPAGVHLPGPSRWPFVVPVGGALILFALAIRPTDSSGQPTAPVNWPLLAAGLAVTAVAIVGWLRDAMREWRRAEGIEGGPTLVTASHASAALSPGLRVSAFPARRVPPLAAGTAAGAHGVPSATVAEPVAEREPPPGVHMPGPSPWPFLAPIALMVIFFGLVFSPAIILGGIVMGLIAAGGWLRDAGYEFRQVDAGHAPEPRTRDAERAFPKVMLAVYAAIGLLSLALVAAPGIIAFANREPGQGGDAGGGGGGGAPSTQISISADRLQFSVDEFRVPAATPFTITFENKEAAPHNVAIYPNSQLTEALFMGEIITGPNTITYNVDPLSAGEYYFVCNVHPNMNGAVIAQ